MDNYVCESCKKQFSEFDMNFKAAQEDKIILCLKCREFRQHMVATTDCILLIKKKHGSVPTNGEVECPLCQGVVRYSIAAYNGHTAGRCETEDCLCWRE